MHLLADEAAQVATVKDHWRRQYYDNGVWATPSAAQTYDRLSTLPPTAKAADVAAIIGNDSWVGYECFECGKRHPVALEIGQDDLERRALCLTCVDRMSLFVQGVREALKL